MSGQASSISSLISLLLLSDYRVMKLCLATDFSRKLELRDLRENTYISYQPWAARYPDHVFDTAWQAMAEKSGKGNCVVLQAMQTLTDEHLVLEKGHIRVQTKKFGAWQQAVMSRVSAIAIQAYADVHFNVGMHLPSRVNPCGEASSPWARTLVPLLRPEHAAVSDYISSECLHETHLHLNGSTHAEICWLRALRNTRAETIGFVKKWDDRGSTNTTRELVQQVNPELTPLLFHDNLRGASRLREILVSFSHDEIPAMVTLPGNFQALLQRIENHEKPEDPSEVPYFLPATIGHYKHDIADEISWLSAIFRKLEQKPCSIFSRMLHTYLLLKNQYCRLLIQGESHYGFDQFQKLTLTELRDKTEKSYTARFQSFHGERHNVSTTGFLEGRFAPKKAVTDTYNLLKSILDGYLQYLEETKASPSSKLPRPKTLSKTLENIDLLLDATPPSDKRFHKLALVVHFIKRDWSPQNPAKSGPYRHYQLDIDLKKNAGVLLSTLARWPKLHKWVRGLDAAANELHAPPDVFAPIFRVCRQAGIHHRTFHAGEDFRHLLCGISTMWEALNILDLKKGDRLGHGTAMGINPSLWLSRMPPSLTLKRGEWMLGLLAAWQLLRDTPGMQTCINKLQRELEIITHKIFNRAMSALELERSMALRGLNRKDLMNAMNCEDNEGLRFESLNDLWRNEQQLVKKAIADQEDSVKTLWQWLSSTDIQKRAEELVIVDAEFLGAPDYIKIQQALMQQIKERGVIIETLPSSNVRISQYESIDEHHSLRWMRVENHIQEGDPEIMVSLGSDDPGIFATNLETEFYLLFTTLKKNNLSDTDAIDRISKINERGRIYRFHHPTLQ